MNETVVFLNFRVITKYFWINFLRNNEFLHFWSLLLPILNFSYQLPIVSVSGTSIQYYYRMYIRLTVTTSRRTIVYNDCRLPNGSTMFVTIGR